MVDRGASLGWLSQYPHEQARRLVVYRDCGPANTLGTGFDDQVYIGMWDGNGNIGFNDVLTIPLSFSNISSVPVVLGNPCGTPPPDLCIEEAIYSTQVTLPANPYGWDLVWQRCCRNPSISNLQNFGGTDNPGATFVTHVPGTTAGATAPQNSSPVFQELPPVAVCANFDFSWDHSAIDPDGDELSYSFCAPFDGGGTGFADVHGGSRASPLVVRPRLGHAVAFPGALWHCGEPITRGRRYVIAAFLWVASEAAVEAEALAASSLQGPP